MKRLAFHEALGLLDVGDLHPGGAPATEFLLAELDKAAPRQVLEVGAGIGRTTARMPGRGWQVTALEPSAVLRRKLENTLSITAHGEDFQAFHAPDACYDAVIGESSFYGMPLPQAFEKVYRLLRPGGLFASLEMIWTEEATPEGIAQAHDETKRIFGIPVGPREAITWRRWEEMLTASGFSRVAGQSLPSGSLHADGNTRRTIIRSSVRHPIAFLQYLNHRLRARAPRIPAGWMETRMAVWKRP